MLTNLDFPNIQNLKPYLGRDDVQLDIFLDIICQRLQLDVTREEKLQSAYKHITECIENDIFFDVNETLMYAFGSRALYTVVKPFKRKEYDLDFVVQIILSNTDLSPQQLISKLFNCLNNNGRFKGKVQYLRYGVRVIYAGSFHVDIMLGLLTKDSKLLVPDRKDDKFVNRNPKGFIKWYESNYIIDYQNIRLHEYYKQYYPMKFSHPLVIEARAETEEIKPMITYAEVQPIQRVNQLVKRHRDIFFLKNMTDYKTSTVILTTLVGDNYNKETSIYDGMNGFISKNIALFESSGLTPFRLINPADRNSPEDRQENLTDKWEKDIKYYQAFRQYIRQLKSDWFELHEKKTIRERAKFLQNIFGENIVNVAYEALNEHYKELGLSYDKRPLPAIIEPPIILPAQAALASMNRNRKPYYGG